MIPGVSADKSTLYEALFELSQSLSGHDDLESLCRALSHSLKRIINFDFLTLLLSDSSGVTLQIHELISSESINRENVPRSFPTGDNNPGGWVWTHQQPLFIERLENEIRWPELLDLARARGLKSLLLVPLTAEKKRLGVLGLGFFAPLETTQDEMNFFHRVASEFASTIHAYLTQQQYMHERDRLKLLFEVTTALVSKLSPDALFTAISAQLHKVIAFDVVVLTLLERKTGDVLLGGIHYDDSLDLDFDLTRVRPEGLPLGESLATGKPVVIDRPDFQRFPSPHYKRFMDKGFFSMCSIPLMTPDSKLGTLELARRNDRRFSEEDIELLVQVGSQIAIALENSLAYRELDEMKEKLAMEKIYLEDEIRFDQNLGNMLGESAAFQSVLKNIQIVGPTDATVLILGETGVGKELVARAIHERSGRSKNSFVRVNCAAIPANLLESEFFGHEKGAFTGALTQRIGRFELANQGTLFLDEIGEIPIELQPKLLRAIQEQEFERLGGNRTIHTDIRFIAASNRNLKAMMDEGSFRSDLFYRLHVFPVAVPPLKDRREDIPLLARFFIQKFAQRLGRKIDSIPPAAMDALTCYEWPGNIRELQNVIERSVILSRNRIFELAMPEIDGTETAPPSMHKPSIEAERERILKALRASNGLVSGPTGAARRLGLKRTTLQARMKKLGITREYQ